MIDYYGRMMDHMYKLVLRMPNAHASKTDLADGHVTAVATAPNPYGRTFRFERQEGSEVFVVSLITRQGQDTIEATLSNGSEQALRIVMNKSTGRPIIQEATITLPEQEPRVPTQRELGTFTSHATSMTFK
tara:strand:+ start:214 stop:606 length:393 start_codon:yes stop_codon:yes gene_type:complete